jgi:hypothetical protein
MPPEGGRALAPKNAAKDSADACAPQRPGHARVTELLAAFARNRYRGAHPNLPTFRRSFDVPKPHQVASTFALAAAAAMALAPTPAAAQYLDPGAGSIVVQAAIAIAIGLAATLKLYWHNISTFWSSRRSKSEKES